MNIRILALASVLALVSSCKAASVMATPVEIKTIPVQQAVMLESAIDSINANHTSWVTADGNVRREAILGVLEADKNAWDQLDRYYNGPVETVNADPSAPAIVVGRNQRVIVRAEDKGGDR